MKYKLVMCDLDGTLLKNDKSISQYTRNMLAKLKEYGILFGIATGRPIATVKELIKDWGIADYTDVVIGYNGAHIYDVKTQTIEEYFALKGETVQEIMHHFEDLDVNFSVFYNHAFHMKKEDEIAHMLSRNNKCPFIVESDFTWLNHKEVPKLIIASTKEYLPTVIERSKSLISTTYRGIQTSPLLFEYIDNRISKAFGIQKFCEKHDMIMEEVVGFGDNSNDLEMLQECGLGVAMENSSEDAKQASNAITKSNEEDGVAWYIENYLIKEESHVY